MPNSGARHARPSGGKNPPLARVPTARHGTRAPAERVPKRPHLPARHVHFWERTRSCDTRPLSLDSNRVSTFCAVRRPGARQAAALKRLYVRFSRVCSRRQAMLVRSPIHTSHAWHDTGMQWRFSSAFEDTSLFQSLGSDFPKIPHHNTLVLMRVPCAVPMCSRNPFLRQRRVQRVHSFASRWACQPMERRGPSRVPPWRPSRKEPSKTGPWTTTATGRSSSGTSSPVLIRASQAACPRPTTITSTRCTRALCCAAGGGASRFAVTSLCQHPNGTIAVRRLEVAQSFPRPQVV